MGCGQAKLAISISVQMQCFYRIFTDCYTRRHTVKNGKEFCTQADFFWGGGRKLEWSWLWQAVKEMSGSSNIFDDTSFATFCCTVLLLLLCFIIIQGGPKKQHKVNDTIILQLYIIESCGFQQNVPKEILYVTKVGIWIQQINILCYCRWQSNCAKTVLPSTPQSIKMWHFYFPIAPWNINQFNNFWYATLKRNLTQMSIVLATSP